MKEKIITERLDCTLTPEEKSACAQNAARAHSEIQRIEGDKKTANAGFATQIKEQTAVHHKNSECVRTGIETRQVEVQVAYDTVSRIVRYRRLDTHEVYERRKMTDDEYRTIKAEQDAMELPFEDDDTPEFDPQQEAHDAEALAQEERERPWIPLLERRPTFDVVVETAQFDVGQGLIKQQPNGVVYAAEDLGYDDRTGGTEPEEWPITHWRPLASEEANTEAPSVPLETDEWIPVSDSSRRPSDDVKVETALYHEDSQEYEQLENGYVDPVKDEAWKHSNTAGNFGTTEWEISHWRMIQTPEGDE